MPKQLEKKWEHGLELIFNGKKVNKLTITDHYQFKHHKITNELILILIKMLDGIRVDETDYQGNRKVYKVGIKYQEKKYRLVFWFKDETDNHLWIRNCYQIDSK